MRHTQKKIGITIISISHFASNSQILQHQRLCPFQLDCYDEVNQLKSVSFSIMELQYDPLSWNFSYAWRHPVVDKFYLVVLLMIDSDAVVVFLVRETVLMWFLVQQPDGCLATDTKTIVWAHEPKLLANVWFYLVNLNLIWGTGITSCM